MGQEKVIIIIPTSYTVGKVIVHCKSSAQLDFDAF